MVSQTPQRRFCPFGHEKEKDRSNPNSLVNETINPALNNPFGSTLYKAEPSRGARQTL
jgi:hypothetical protein